MRHAPFLALVALASVPVASGTGGSGIPPDHQQPAYEGPPPPGVRAVRNADIGFPPPPCTDADVLNPPRVAAVCGAPGVGSRRGADISLPPASPTPARRAEAGPFPAPPRTADGGTIWPSFPPGEFGCETPRLRPGDPVVCGPPGVGARSGVDIALPRWAPRRRVDGNVIPPPEPDAMLRPRPAGPPPRPHAPPARPSPAVKSTRP